jgi:beta-lactamase class A
MMTAGAVLAAGTLIGPRAHAIGGAADAFAAELKRLERDSGGRLGVALLDAAIGKTVGRRLDERFAMCSTFKLLVVAAVLGRVDAGKEDPTQRIRVSSSDLIAYSPVTKEHLGGDGMTVAELCEAAVAHSDNAAANLLVARLGGPPQITAFARTLGDPVTRLDRVEPGLNEGHARDVRDTTTPGAMARNLQALALGKALSSASRDQLVAWLVGSKTGDTRIRAGVPAGWRVGDKTGTGNNGTANDIAVIWPPQRAPVIVTVYLTQAKVPVDMQNATIAAVARAAVAAIGG